MLVMLASFLLPPVAHVAGALPVEIRLAAAVVAGFGATAVMTLVMEVLPEGDVPPYVAAAPLFGTSAGRISKRQADIAHYAAGMLAGVLYELAVSGLDLVQSASQQLVLLGRPVPLTLSDPFAVMFVIGFLYVFFGYLVFPRFGGRLYADTTVRRTVRRDWFISAMVYGGMLLIIVPLLYAFLPT
jgi:hypothetical protein